MSSGGSSAARRELTIGFANAPRAGTHKGARRCTAACVRAPDKRSLCSPSGVAATFVQWATRRVLASLWGLVVALVFAALGIGDVECNDGELQGVSNE